MLVRRAEMLAIECIVRGYLAGSACKEYERAGTVHGMPMPAGLRHADRLPEPIFTPSTKATEGHDENIGMAEAVDLVGKEAAEAAADICAWPPTARAAARGRGARHRDLRHQVRARLHRRRSWPSATRCSPPTRRGSGRPTTAPRAPTRPPSTSSRCATGSRASRWDKQPPPPALPAEVVAATSTRYVDAYERISGRSLGRLVRCLSMATDPTFSVLVEVRLRPGIADPQGATIERALPALGLRRGLRRAGGQGVPLRRRGRR